MRLFPVFLVAVLFLTACDSNSFKTHLSDSENKAQNIIDEAIAKHGGAKFNAVKLSFTFRDKQYAAYRNNGRYSYSRTFTDTLGLVKDELTNEGFTRTINNKKQTLPAEKVKAYSESVNAVIYFALLPFGLNDPAVQKEYLGTVAMKQTPYHKIKVTFAQEGGGSHYEDRFLYWINQKTGTMDYFSYTEGGIRFREVLKVQEVNGIRFQDYINYKTRDSLDYLNIDKQFESGKLEELSRIELKNIKVELL